MTKTNSKGFTLIELLVVIAIIGILSTLAILSLSGSRDKANDAKRISDVRQLAMTIEAENASNPGGAMSGCTTANVSTITCTGPGDISKFSTVKDPSGVSSACLNSATAYCQYSISNQAGSGTSTLSDYEIKFWLKAGSGSLPAGLDCVKSNLQWATGTTGCP